MMDGRTDIRSCEYRAKILDLEFATCIEEKSPNDSGKMHEITPKTRKQILDSRRSKILKELMKKSRFSSGGIEVISEEKCVFSPQVAAPQ